jgi:hypothetical protein
VKQFRVVFSGHKAASICFHLELNNFLNSAVRNPYILRQLMENNGIHERHGNDDEPKRIFKQRKKETGFNFPTIFHFTF